MIENDILTVYETLRKITVDMPDYNPNKKGYVDMLYLLKEGLKFCPQVNHAVEKRRLERRLNKLEILVDDLKQDNQVLMRQNKKLKSMVSEAVVEKDFDDGFKKLQLDVNGYQVNFDIQATIEEFEVHFEAASLFATEKRIRKHPENTIKSRMMEYLRLQGFKCK